MKMSKFHSWVVLILLSFVIKSDAFFNLHIEGLHTQKNKLDGTLHSKIKSRVINSPVLDFAPWLELHHIVLLQDKLNPGIACAIDFSPLDQTNPKTLTKLLMGQEVPAEIRINWLADFDGKVDSVKTLAINSSKLSSNNLNRFRYPPAKADRALVAFVDDVVASWPREMNFYFRNCQHFSDFVMRHANK